MAVWFSVWKITKKRYQMLEGILAGMTRDEEGRMRNLTRY